MIVPPTIAVNLICAVLAVLVEDIRTFVIGWAGACTATYAFLLYQELPMRYRSLAMELRWDLTHDDHYPGERLSSIKELATNYETTSTTMVRAVRILADEGLIDVIPGRGMFYVGAEQNTFAGDLRGRIEWHFLDVLERGTPGTPIPSDKAMLAAYEAPADLVQQVRVELRRRGLLRITEHGHWVKA